jgi:AcrR family transcriptional regulator
MKSTPKLSSEERREAIIRAVRKVFAEKGFHGTTTRELAEAAGVSEALLFKHFPTKESLYSAMQLSWCQAKASGEAERLCALEPSASSLVLLVHRLVHHLLVQRPGCEGEEAQRTRLILRSLMEDGEFARLWFQGMPAHWNRKATECIKAAVAAGDAVDGPVRADLRAWFAHHMAVMLMIHLQPTEPAVDYGVSRDKLVEQAVWFILRGMGLKDEAIKRHYNPQALALFAS